MRKELYLIGVALWLATTAAHAQRAGEFGTIVGVTQSEGESGMAARGYQPGPGGTWYNPRERRCTRMAIVSGRVEAMHIEPVMICHHEDRTTMAPVAPAWHPGEVPEDYDLVCSSVPSELGDYTWDVDRDRYVHAGRFDFTPAEQARTIMVQVSGGRAKALFPARLGPTAWTMLDGASVNPGGIRTRLGNGATLAISPGSGAITIRVPMRKPKGWRVLYAGRCAMITAVGSRAW